MTDPPHRRPGGETDAPTHPDPEQPAEPGQRGEPVAAEPGQPADPTAADLAGADAAADPALADIADLGYERARDELVAIVARLEGGQAPLEECLTLWRRGEALAAHCSRWLDAAQAQIGGHSQA